MPGNPVAEEAVRNVLLGVMDPELGDNIVDLGMVQVIEIDSRSGDVDVTIALTTDAHLRRRSPDLLPAAGSPRIARRRAPSSTTTATADARWSD